MGSPQVGCVAGPVPVLGWDHRSDTGHHHAEGDVIPFPGWNHFQSKYYSAVKYQFSEEGFRPFSSP